MSNEEILYMVVFGITAVLLFVGFYKAWPFYKQLLRENKKRNA